VSREMPNPGLQAASGNGSLAAADAAAAPHTAAAAPAAAPTPGQQQQQQQPAVAYQRPRRAAAAAGVAAAVFALSNDDGAPAKVQKQGSGSGRKASSTPPAGYTVASLADREKQLWEAKQDKERAAIVKKWLDEAGNEDAPVAELVSAAKFAVALARESGTKQFLQQATMLKNYMQSSDKFAPHFSASL